MSYFELLPLSSQLNRGCSNIFFVHLTLALWQFNIRGCFLLQNNCFGTDYQVIMLYKMSESACQSVPWIISGRKCISICVLHIGTPMDQDFPSPLSLGRVCITPLVRVPGLFFLSRAATIPPATVKLTSINTLKQIKTSHRPQALESALTPQSLSSSWHLGSFGILVYFFFFFSTAAAELCYLLMTTPLKKQLLIYRPT